MRSISFRSLLVCLLINGVLQNLLAQEARVYKGQVVDENLLPVANATLREVATGLGVTTNVQGEFALPASNDDSTEVEIACLGYQRQKARLSSNGFLQIILREDLLALQEAVVTATRAAQNAEMLPIPITVIDQKQIQAMGSLRLNEILQEQTGLAIVNDGHGQGLQMQGFAADYTLILIDGEPLIGRTAGTLELSRLTVHNIKRIEIVKGPSSSLYGSEALAGVINIITEQPSEGIKGQLRTRYGSNNTLDIAGDVSFTHKKLGATIFANRYSTSGYDLSPETVGATISPFQNYTLQGKLNYRLSPQTEFIFSGRLFRQDQESKFLEFGSGDILVNQGQEQDWNFNPRLVHRFNDKVKMNLHLYATQYNTATQTRQNATGQQVETTFFVQNFQRPELQVEANFGGKHHLVAGSGYIRESVSATRYDRLQANHSVYGFAQYEFTPNDRWSVIVGARQDYNSLFGGQFSPKLAVLYKPWEWLRLRASVGRGFKAPDFRQLYLNFGNNAVGYSVFGTQELARRIEELQGQGIIQDIMVNPTAVGLLKPESSTAFNLDVQVKPTNWFKFSVNFFRNQVQDLIETLPVARKTNGQFVFSYVNIARIVTQGIETELTVRPAKNFTISAGYQFLDAFDQQVVDQIAEGSLFTRDLATLASRRLTLADYGGLFNRSRHMANFKIFYENYRYQFNTNVRLIYRGRYGFGDLNGNLILDDAREYVASYYVVNWAFAKQLGSMFYAQVGIDNLFDFTNTTLIPTIPGRIYYATVSLRLSNQKAEKKR
ncbi:MAG TPA: TonB-dependent receptor [Microscillaceae bacterium]|nr:TonB-dependent receptor [Microscillaceae bacterium]